MIRHSGKLLIATGILHNFIGIVLFSPILGDILQAGVFNSIDPHFDRNAAFWFLFGGLMMVLLGMMVQWMYQQTGTVPAFIGWWLLAIGVIGVIMMPASGFWLVLPQAYILLRGQSTMPALQSA